VSDLADDTAVATPPFATTSFEKGEKPLQLLLTYLPTYLRVLFFGKEKQCKWGGRGGRFLASLGPRQLSLSLIWGGSAKHLSLSHPPTRSPAPW